MSSNKIMKEYVSEIDKFLEKFDREHPATSFSQQSEIAKHQRVHALRDNISKSKKPKKLWENF